MSSDTAAPAVDQPAPGGALHRRRTGTPPRWLSPAGLALLAALPALVSIVALLARLNGRYMPYGDQAVLELNVRDVGSHAVLLGPYSRFGWYHPGPLGAYLLAVPYHLLGGAHESLSIGALLIAGLSLVGSALVIRRRTDTLVAVFSIAAIAVGVRLLGPGFLRDSWNPCLPVLPLLLGCLLAWTALEGDAWALPVMVLPLSLAVQSHVGYLAPVGAISAVVVVVLAVRLIRSRRLPRRRWLAVLAAVGLLVLLWLPPLIQELTRTPGNAGVVLHYLRTAHPDSTAAIGLRTVADEFGKLPAYLVGGHPSTSVLLPRRWPAAACAVGLALTAAAVLVALARRRRDLLWLVVLFGAVTLSGVAAVSRINGLAFFYVTLWTAVIGMLAAIVVGAALLPELQRLARRAGSVGMLALRVPVVLVAVAAVLVLAIGTERAETPQTDYAGSVQALTSAVVTDLDRTGTRPDVVRVDFAPTSKPVIVGTSFAGSGLVLGLARAHVDVQLDDFWRLPFGARYTDRATAARYVATIAYSDGSSPPPAAGQRLLAVAGEYQVYGGVLPR